MEDMVMIGLGFHVAASRVVWNGPSRGKAYRKRVEVARSSDRLIDCTLGRRVRSAILLEGGELVLSSMNPETFAARMRGEVRWSKERRESLPSSQRKPGWSGVEYDPPRVADS